MQGREKNLCLRYWTRAAPQISAFLVWRETVEIDIFEDKFWPWVTWDWNLEHPYLRKYQRKTFHTCVETNCIWEPWILPVKESRIIINKRLSLLSHSYSLYSSYRMSMKCNNKHNNFYYLFNFKSSKKKLIRSSLILLCFFADNFRCDNFKINKIRF